MSGTVGPRISPFINTYSLDFDGVDDYVKPYYNFSGNSDFTLSFWIKGGTQPGIVYPGIFPFGIGSKSNSTLGRMHPSSGYQFMIQSYDNTGLNFGNRIIDIDIWDGTWYHIAFTRVDSTGQVFAYVNGINVQWSSAYGSTPSPSITLNPVGNLYFGTALGDLASAWNGNLDEFSVFNRVLTQSEITSISSEPTNLTPLNPIAWYRMGDNGAYKSPQWIIPSNENKDKVSNYSMAFDGVGDKVSIGTTLDLGINSTLSFWIKRGRISTSEVWFGEDSYSSDYLVTITSSTILYFRINTSYVGWNYPTVKSILNNTTEWVNVCIVRSGNSVELFLNGISYGTGNSNAGTPGATVTRFDTIGASPYGLHTFAQFDEIAAWNNNTVNPVDIYNGGTPTTISGAVAHYKMGEDATFNGGNWTLPDSVGTNDGTSANMTIEDRVGSAPSSSNNALSFNMDLIDRVEDTP